MAQESAARVAGLRERLRSLGAAPPRSPRPPVERALPKGFEPVETPYGTAYRRVEIRPEGRVEGRPPALQHAYLDTETTGLAGGTGTYAFCAALARVNPGVGLEVVQVFLPEPAGESAFLHLLQEELRATPALGTYNGASFDLPLLRTRWVMARMPGDFEHAEHVDLLHLARALLKQRLESCALRRVEEALLGFEREADVPGAMVPDAYFMYLRHGSSPMLEAALEHNRQDVVSLHYLHARLLLRLEGKDPWMEAADWLALGRLLIRTGRRADGWRALRNAAAMAQGPPSAAAALLIARRLVRHRRPAAAAAFLARVHALEPGDPALAVARARVLEWQLHQAREALEVVESALARRPAAPLAIDLERRRDRLRQKAAALDGGGGRGRRDGRRVRRPAPAHGGSRQWRQGLLLDDRAEGAQHHRVEGAGVAGQGVDGLGR